MKVLLVEDNKNISKALKYSLEKNTYNVLNAYTLEEAKNLSSSYSLKDIAKILSDKYNLKKNYVYDLLLKKGDF